MRRSVKGVAAETACVAGALAALPTYWHVFFRSGGSNAMLHPTFVLPVVVVLTNFVILLPLAIAGARRSGVRMAAMVVAAALLLVATIAVHLPEGNEHNLSNAAQCLLAVPAGAAFARNRRAFAILAAALLPATASTLLAYAGRPPMPIAASGRELVRTPDQEGLQQLYGWIRRETSWESIFIADPEAPVKMSGNVSELPAFTARTLFTDTPSYLTTPNRDAVFRAELAIKAAAAQGLTAGQRAYLARFRRPVYVLTYHAGEAESMRQLAAIYGPPVFQSGIAAVFQMHP
jgi:hypothetical protein